MCKRLRQSAEVNSKPGSTHDEIDLAGMAAALEAELQTLVRGMSGLNATIGRINKIVEACDYVSVQDTHVR